MRAFGVYGAVQGATGGFRSAPNYGATTSFKQSSSITKTTQQAHGIEREGDTGCTNGATGGSWRGRWAFELGDTRALREERQSGEERVLRAGVGGARLG